MLNQNSGLVIWKEKGNSYYNNKDYKRAIDCYNQALEIDPNHTPPDSLHGMGNAYYNLKLY